MKKRGTSHRFKDKIQKIYNKYLAKDKESLNNKVSKAQLVQKLYHNLCKLRSLT
jgi:hypothetical protein